MSAVQIKDIVNNAINPSGVVRFKIVSLPRMGGYRITLISRRGGMSGTAMDSLLDQLHALGYKTRIKATHSFLYTVIQVEVYR